MPTLTNPRLAAGIFAVVLLCAVFSWWMSLAPSPLPADAPADVFSAYRALEHVKAMAMEPHPGGSHANENVYDYLEEQLRGLGVEMTVERPIMLMERHIVERNGAILARLRGEDSTGAFAVDAHFDSTPYGPGAADDVSGCAAMLETIRALNSGPKLKNDIIFCFSDKEEMGGQGGPGVFMRHEWFKDVKALLGLETRGTAGPALMFETGQDNGFMIRQLAKSDARPRATSIMFDFYDRMPFGSDFSNYKDVGIPGMNVAYIDNFCYYHTRNDSPEHISLASLQHHGQYTLGLCRQFGNVSLENCKAPNATYFNTIGSHMVVYPRSWGHPLAIVVLMLFLAALIFGFVRGGLSIRGMLAGASIFPLASLLTFPGLAWFAWTFIFLRFREHALYRNDSLSMAVMLIGLGVLTLCAALVRRVRPQNLLAGALLWWAAGLTYLEFGLPGFALHALRSHGIGLKGLEYGLQGGAYALLWPLLFASFGLLALFHSPKSETALSPRRYMLAAASILPTIFVLVPSLVVMTYALTALASPGVLLLAMLLMTALLPQAALAPGRRLLLTGGGIIAAGAAIFAIATVSNTPSASRPRQDCLAYAVNFDTNEAWWISSDATSDSWLKQYVPDDAPWVSIAEFLEYDDGYTYRRAPAPSPPFGKSVVNVLDDRTENGRRYLKLFVDSPRDAQTIQLDLESQVEVYRAVVLGIELPGNVDRNGERRRWFHIELDTMPFEGGEIELEVEPGKPLDFCVREVSFSLPQVPGFIPRPPEFMTQPNRRLDRSRDLGSEHTYSICNVSF